MHVGSVFRPILLVRWEIHDLLVSMLVSALLLVAAVVAVVGDVAAGVAVKMVVVVVCLQLVRVVVLTLDTGAFCQWELDQTMESTAQLVP